MAAAQGARIVGLRLAPNLHFGGAMRVTRFFVALLFCICVIGRTARAKGLGRQGATALTVVGSVLAFAGSALLFAGVAKKLDYGFSALDTGTPKNPVSEDQQGSRLAVAGATTLVIGIPLAVGGGVALGRADRATTVAACPSGLVIHF